MAVSIQLPRQVIQEQVVEISKKLQLLEGGRKAHYESSQIKIKKNHDIILHMRQDNLTIHARMVDLLAGGDRVVDIAFEGRTLERSALGDKPGRLAVVAVDQKVCESRKRLDAFRYTTNAYHKKLYALQDEYDFMVKTAADAAEMKGGVSNAAQFLRQLENRMDKAGIKYHEAAHIGKVYDSIKYKLEQESLTFYNQIDKQKKELAKLGKEILEVQEMYNIAQIARDNAKEELSCHENVVYRERKARESALTKLQSEADAMKADAEQFERKMQRDRSTLEEDRSEEEIKPHLSEKELERKRNKFEEQFVQIREATGVSEIKDVLAQLKFQEDTCIHLKELKSQNLLRLKLLRKKQTKLEEKYSTLRFSGGGRHTSGQRMLKDFQQHLCEQEKKKHEVEKRFERATNVLASVTTGIQYLSNKLQHLKMATIEIPSNYGPLAANEYIVDVLFDCEENLVKLMKSFDERKLVTVLHQKEDEVHSSIENKMPHSNIRIALPSETRQDIFEDEDDGGDDNTTTPTRADLKSRCEQIVGVNMKKSKLLNWKKRPGF